jgi:hypothetical protein
MPAEKESWIFFKKNICGGLCNFSGGLKPPEKRGGK